MALAGTVTFLSVFDLRVGVLSVTLMAFIFEVASDPAILGVDGSNQARISHSL